MAILSHATGFAVDRVDALAERADPQQARVVLDEGRDVRLVGLARRDLAPVFVSVGPGPRIPLAQAPVARTNPEHAAAILEDGRNGVVAQARAVLAVVRVTNERVVGPIHEVEAAVGTDPEAPVAVLEQGRDPIPGDRTRIVGIMAEMAKLAFVAVEEVQAAIGPDP